MSATIQRPVVRQGDTPTETFPWGNITWLDNAEITGNEVLTFGIVEINAGQGNPKHHHPNCDEILYVIEGELNHTLGPEVFHLKAGDMIHIPLGIEHQATNPGTVTCRMAVTYNTGRRQVVGEFGTPPNK